MVVNTAAGDIQIDAFTDTGGAPGGIEVRTVPTSGTGIDVYSNANVSFNAGEWHLVGLEITTTSGSLFVDGVESAKVAHPLSAAPTGATLDLGAIRGGGPTAAWKLRFDDFRCTATP